MAKRGLRTCCVCHDQYYFCPVCNSNDADLETWHFVYCSENCKDIYNATSKFENGEITAHDAQDKLKALDLSKIANFGESYQRSISKIKKEVQKDTPSIDAKNTVDTQKTVKQNKYENFTRKNKSIITKANKEAESNVE